MVQSKQAPNQHQHSAKVRVKPLQGPSFEIADFGNENDVQILPDDTKHLNKKSNPESPELLSTAELISAVGQVWDRASRSLARVQPRARANCSDSVSREDDQSCYLVANDNFVVVSLIDSGYYHVDLKSACSFSCIAQQSLECMRQTQKISYKPYENYFIENLLMRNCHDSSIGHNMWSKGWSVHSPAHENDESLSDSAGTGYSGSYNDGPNLKDLSLGGSFMDVMSRKSSVSSLYSDYFLETVQDTPHMGSTPTALNLGLKSDASISEPGSSHEANHHEFQTDDLVDNETRRCEDLDARREFQGESSSSVSNKPLPLLAKQEHAVSGALAGIFVSLCLHPIDTVKTVVQSCQGQKSIFYMGQSIISERGLLGLYRGITTNITTSAPVSAIYTFTYESVKGFLLPSLAKEHHSVAHCTAGACASIATSFIFTPSEHIKQQMQVNSKYQNCWSVASRIIEKGGLQSLYAGWGAVLCRNIPHSIIKFYTYERLKQMFASTEPSNEQPKMLQTLFCGGLAGSTAALFSTPFDVVKTRLQTQRPGSARRYYSILNALQEIREHEGIRGLYRGLIPRLVMYMSQGALFFASYEFSKSLFSLELCQHKPEILQYNEDTIDDPLLSS